MMMMMMSVLPFLEVMMVTIMMIFFQLQVVNHHLLKDLTGLGLWNDNMKMKIMANNGSVQVWKFVMVMMMMMMMVVWW